MLGLVLLSLKCTCPAVAAGQEGAKFLALLRCCNLRPGRDLNKAACNSLQPLHDADALSMLNENTHGNL